MPADSIFLIRAYSPFCQFLPSAPLLCLCRCVSDHDDGRDSISVAWFPIGKHCPSSGTNAFSIVQSCISSWASSRLYRGCAIQSRTCTRLIVCPNDTPLFPSVSVVTAVLTYVSPYCPTLLFTLFSEYLVVYCVIYRPLYPVPAASPVVWGIYFFLSLYERDVALVSSSARLCR